MRAGGSLGLGTECLRKGTWAGVSRLSFASGFDHALGGFAFYRQGFVFGVSLVTRWSRIFVFLVSRLALGLLAGAVVSCLCLVVRVRHTATTLLN